MREKTKYIKKGSIVLQNINNDTERTIVKKEAGRGALLSTDLL